MQNSSDKQVNTDNNNIIEDCSIVDGKLIEWNVSQETVVIPDGVTAIGSNAFKNIEMLSNVVIPDSVKTIEKDAFYGCYRLTGISVPDSVTEIGEDAFFGCTHLAHVKLPKGLKIISSLMFCRCTSLEEIDIPDTVTEIGSSAFSSCTKLAKINLSNSINYISQYAFCGTGLTNITLPNSITTVTKGLFDSCKQLREVEIPESVTKIDDLAFRECKELRTVIIKGSDVQIHDGAFHWCRNLSTILVEPSAEIGESYDCPLKELMYLSWINNPDELEALPDKKSIITSSLRKEKSLRPILFRFDMVNALRLYAGRGKITADNIDSIYLILAEAEHATKCKEYLLELKPNLRRSKTAEADIIRLSKLWLYETVKDGTLRIKSYIGKSMTPVVPDRIGDAAVTSIGEGAFEGSDVITVFLPDGLKRIGKKAFKRCTELKHIRIPDSLVSISDEAFSECHALDGVTLPKGIKKIGEDTFRNCWHLKELEIPDTVKTISYTAFRGCVGLADKGCIIINGTLVDYANIRRGIGGRDNIDVVIPDYTERIAPHAFEEERDIRSISIPSSVKTIGDYAFSKCHELEEINIPDSVTEIGECAFQQTNITQITIPASVLSCGDKTFYLCQKLKSVDIYGNLAKLNNGMFAKCNALEHVTMPDTITEIGELAFERCRNLKGVNLPKSLEIIGAHAFESCGGITEIDLPDSLLEIDAAAFYGCALSTITIPSNVKVLRYLFGGKGLKYVETKGNITEVEKNAFWECQSLYRLPVNPVSVIGESKKCQVKNIAYLTWLNEPEKLECLPYKEEILSGALERIEELLPLIYKFDLVNALRFFTENGKLSRQYFQERYINYAKAAGAEKCTEYLSAWFEDKNSIESSEKVKDPYLKTVQDKIWGYDELEDGTLSITKYKNFQKFTDMDMLLPVPNRIGKTPVSEVGTIFCHSSFSDYTRNGLEFLVIEDGIKRICERAFCNYKELKGVYLSNTAEVIGDRAFQNCYVLERIAFPESLKSIGKEAFHSTALINVRIPDSVVSIGSNAFSWCSRLTEVTLPGTAEFDESIFENCKNLKKITFTIKQPDVELILPDGVEIEVKQ